MVERYIDWPRLLSRFLKERQKMPFEWSVNDCLAFVAQWVEYCTGKDFFEEFSDYTDRLSALRLVERSGGAEAIITKCLGEGKSDILNAKRGDVVLVKFPEITAGIVDDTGQRIALVSREGLRRIPLTHAYRYWSF